MVVITCPHCGKRFEYEGAYERADINGEAAFFLPLPPDEERHIDQRLACPSCYAKAGSNRFGAATTANPEDPPHPFGTRYHREVRLAHPVGQKPFGAQ